MKKTLCARYAVFTAGLLWAALGISLITKAGLGTSPVTSLSYVLSFLLPPTLGAFTFLVNASMLVGQAAILRREFSWIQLLQLPATFVFSASIDLFMRLLEPFAPAWYPARILMLLSGCAALGFGIALEVLADVLILPAEGFVKVAARKLRREFGAAKTVFDLLLVSCAAAVSLLGLGRISGIREGTIVAALTVGGLSRYFLRGLTALRGRASARRGPGASAGLAPAKR